MAFITIWLILIKYIIYTFFLFLSLFSLSAHAESSPVVVWPNLLNSVQHVESNGNVVAVSDKGAEGLFQFMPRTAAWLKINPYDPAQARSGAQRYLSYLIKRFGSLEKALVAWNWGEGNLMRSIRRYGYNLANAPRETRNFVRKVYASLTHQTLSNYHFALLPTHHHYLHYASVSLHKVWHKVGHHWKYHLVKLKRHSYA